MIDYSFSVFEAAQILHDYAMGACDISNKRASENYEKLKKRIELWTNPIRQTELFDNAAKNLVLAAIKEYERSQSGKPSFKEELFERSSISKIRADEEALKSWSQSKSCARLLECINNAANLGLFKAEIVITSSELRGAELWLQSQGLHYTSFPRLCESNQTVIVRWDIK